MRRLIEWYRYTCLAPIHIFGVIDNTDLGCEKLNATADKTRPDDLIFFAMDSYPIQSQKAMKNQSKRRFTE